MKKRDNLKTRVRKLNIDHEKIEKVDIWLFCDQERKEVESKSRSLHLIKWRHLRNFVAYIRSGYNGLQCSRDFNMHHVTFINSIRNMCDALDNRHTSDPLYQVYCKMVQNYPKFNTSLCKDEKEVLGLVELEKMVG